MNMEKLVGVSFSLCRVRVIGRARKEKSKGYEHKQ